MTGTERERFFDDAWRRIREVIPDLAEGEATLFVSGVNAFDLDGFYEADLYIRRNPRLTVHGRGRGPTDAVDALLLALA